MSDTDQKTTDNSISMANEKPKLFTIGIEGEFQVIDPLTRDLRSHMHQIVDGGKTVLHEQVKAETHQSVVEVGTNVCNNVTEARKEVVYLRRMVAELAAKQGLRIAAAGTHPFSRWQEQPITDNPSICRSIVISNKITPITRCEVNEGDLIIRLRIW